jgi:EmrB/QacA subfamily drug resistance transporter
MAQSTEPQAGKAPDSDRRRRTLTLVACSLSLFMVLMDSTVVNVALPSIQHHFLATFSDLQWIVDAYVLVLASLLLFSGSLGDRIGRRRVFLTGLVIFCMGSLLCSLSPSLGWLVAFRMLQAVGGSMLTPSTLAIIANTFQEPRERAAAIGVWGGISGLSLGSGPVIGGLLVQTIDWRAIFWVNLPIGAIAVVMALMFIRESRAPRARRLDMPGQGLAVLFLAALTYALIEAPNHGWGSTRSLVLFALALAALVAFIVVELRVREPLLDMKFFRSASFSGAAAIAVMAFVVLTGFIFLNTLYLQEVRGYSPLQAGLYTLPATLMIAAVAPISGQLTGRMGPRLPLALSGVFFFASMVLLLYVTPSVHYLYLFVAYACLGVGSGLVNAPITNAAVSGMPPDRAGAASAVASTARNVGSVLGVALLGSITTTHFKALLPVRIAPLHLPAQVQARILAAAVNGAAAGESGSAAGNLGLAIRHAVGEAFTTASHSGYRVSALVAALLLITALAATGRRQAAAGAAGQPARQGARP